MTLRIERTRDVAACTALRRMVFIEEQGISPADECDGLDDDALHFLALRDGQPVGTARVLQDGVAGKIGRVCVLAPERGRGIGASLIRAVIAALREDGFVRARLAAQIQTLGFYESLGFMAEGPVFDDAGLPHRWMEAKL